MSDFSSDLDDLDANSLAAKLANPQPKRSEESSSQAKEPRAAPQTSEDTTINDWLRGFAGSTPLRVTLERKTPEYWGGKQVAGVLEHYDELPAEEEIKERFGGGKFQIRVHKQHATTNRYLFAGARTFKIAGDPKLNGEIFQRSEADDKMTTPPNDDLTKHALSLVERTAANERERADRLDRELREGNNRGMDPVMMNMLVEPFKLQITTLQNMLVEKDRVIAEKDKTIHELSAKKPETLLQDNLILKMYDGESAKLMSLREQYDSERRQLAVAHQDEIKRIEHRYDMDKSNMLEAHKREIKTLESNYEHRIKSLESSFEMRLESKDNRIKEIERIQARTESELAELRAKKDKTPLDQMQELAAMRSNFAEFFGDGKEDDEGSTVEKVIGAIANSPIAQAVGQRLQNPVPAPAPSPQPTQIRRIARKAPVQTQSQASAAPPAPSVPGISPAELQGAVTFIESAVANGTDPVTFAQSVRNMIPVQIVEAIKTYGVDVFLDEIVKVPPDSPLSTQLGRTFARKVAKELTSPTA